MDKAAHIQKTVTEALAAVENCCSREVATADMHKEIKRYYIVAIT